MRRLGAALVLAAASFAASATTVMVMSIGPNRVDLLVNGSMVRVLRPGEASPESSTSSSVVLHADARGHFLANATINGVAVRALVDTGASTVALNLSDAQRLGINLAGARRIDMHTAGGVRPGLRARLAVVQLGDIVLHPYADEAPLIAE